jgi:phenylalanyl-tRNA synthetase beta chain
VLPGLLRTAARNVGHGAGSFGIFELATVTLPTGGVAPILPVDVRPSEEELAALNAAIPDQPMHLAIVGVGEADSSGWWGEGRAVTWADAVEAVRGVAAEVGLEVAARNTEQAPWHPGRCAELSVDGVVIGHAGELHPKVCAAFGLPRGCVAAEVDVDVLIDAAVLLRQAPSFSTQPVAKEDVALVVDASVPAADVEAALRAGGGDELESVRLFDVYTGEQVPEGKKSLAFALRFRAADRTLTEKETAAFRQGAVAAATEQLGAVQR